MRLVLLFILLFICQSAHATQLPHDLEDMVHKLLKEQGITRSYDRNARLTVEPVRKGQSFGGNGTLPAVIEQTIDPSWLVESEIARDWINEAGPAVEIGYE